MAATVEIVSQSATSNYLTIQPANGYTVEKVIELLNTRQAFVSGEQVVQWSPPPAEGGIVIANILGNRSEPAQPVWAVVQSEEEE
jgi:hypothetical protein